MTVLDQWPTGIRDTTGFPSVTLDVSEDMKNHLATFCNLAGVSWTDYPEQSTIARTQNWNSTADSRLRTMRKMYERLGLIYRDTDDKIRLSSLGRDICSLKSFVVLQRDSEISRLREMAISILSRYQLRNPSEDDSDRLPDSCDVLPFICLWKVMTSLDNKVHFEEMNRVILRIMLMSELDAAIEKIRNARRNLVSYGDQDGGTLRQYLGEPVFTEDQQPKARIDGWYSFAGWGGLIIEQKVDNQGFRNMLPQAIPLVRRVLTNPPHYYQAKNRQDWYSYYLGSWVSMLEEKAPSSENDQEMLEHFQRGLEHVGLRYDPSFIARFIASCQSKQFVIFTGLSGSGKTQLALAFARWLMPKEENGGTSSAEENRARIRLVSVGADWTSRDNILGYPDALDTSKYLGTQALALMLRADSNKDTPHFLILDEMNLSHVERYFADILSAIESGEPINLHDGPDAKSGIPPQIDVFPSNLYIMGTVNVDETTYMFSPKVLDRANVLEFTVKSEEILSFLDDPRSVDLTKLDGLGASYAKLLVAETQNEAGLDEETHRWVKSEVLLFFNVLAEYGAEFGFRTVKEIVRFVYFHKRLRGANWQFKDAWDAQIAQKLLPKLQGSRKKLEPILCALGTLCYVARDESTDLEELRSQAREAGKLLDSNSHPLAMLGNGNYRHLLEQAYYPLSYNKIIRMLKLLNQNGFASFAEA